MTVPFLVSIAACTLEAQSSRESISSTEQALANGVAAFA
jgi:hypothetical protein